VAEVPEAPFVAQEATQAPKAVATRSAWNGGITFGLVNVPVKLYQQFGDHGLDLHTCHASDGGKLKWLKVCDCCGESGISTTETGKKVSGADVWLTAEEVKSTQSTAPAEFAVDQFVEAGEIDLSLTERQFSVRADKKGDRGYSLLVDALRSTGKVAVGRIVLRTVESVAVLRVVEGELVVSTLKWADQVRDLGLEAPVEAAYNAAEYQTALDLIGAMSGKFSHGDYADPQQARIAELLEAKAA
jgi:DNA end-binding protein Ku